VTTTTTTDATTTTPAKSKCTATPVKTKYTTITRAYSQRDATGLATGKCLVRGLMAAELDMDSDGEVRVSQIDTSVPFSQPTLLGLLDSQGSIVVGILASSNTTITSTPLEATIDITSCNEGTTIVASNATSTTIAII
jgi:hypothetical protein